MSDKKSNENAKQSISIERLSSLARISLSVDETETARRELKKMADYTYLHLDLEGDALPFSYSHGERALREDIPTNDENTDILSCAPETKDGYIVVPRVIEKEEA